MTNNTGWKKFEDEKGFPYYLHERSELKQRDHPKFLEIKQKLDECDWITYAVYRVAFKIRFLQQSLFTDFVPLTLVSGVFERHRLNSTENSLRLESYDIEAILSDIYFAANKQNNLNIDVDLIVELMQNFLYNVYDKNREGLVQVLHLKLIVSLLCNSNLTSLYQYLFNLCSDHNDCVTKLKVQTILSKISDIISYLYEDSSFGHHLINSSVEDCFAKNPGLVGINENVFTNWLMKGPQILSWLPTLHRIKKSESAMHNTKCSYCKISPIVGLKYRCVKCSRYFQCQKCYLTAKVNRMHKLTHNMKEYCFEDNGTQMNHGLIKKLCGLVRCSSEDNSTIIETNPICVKKDWLLRSEPHPLKDIDLIGTVSSPHLQLQLIIKQLEIQNKELQKLIFKLEDGDANERNVKTKICLKNRHLSIAEQIEKLKMVSVDITRKQLRDCHFETLTTNPKIAIESTPIVATFSNSKFSGMSLENTISPITSQRKSKDFDYSILHRAKSQHEIEKSNNSNPDFNDLSTFIGGKPTISSYLTEPDFPNSEHGRDQKIPVYEMQNDLDEALAKLQQILANNFTLDESLGSIDNGELKNAVTEVEGMLTSLIDNVEGTRCNSSVQPNVYKSEFINRVEYM